MALTSSCRHANRPVSRPRSIEAIAMVLLDTNVVSELMRSIPDRAVDSWAAKHAVENLFFSAVGEAELRYGAAIMPEGRRRDKLVSDIERMMRSVFEDRILPFDSSAARGLCLDCRESPSDRSANLPGRRTDCSNRAIPPFGGGDAQRSRFCRYGDRCYRPVGRRMKRPQRRDSDWAIIGVGAPVAARVDHREDPVVPDLRRYAASLC